MGVSFRPCLWYSSCQAYEQAQAEDEPVLDGRLRHETGKRQRLGAGTPTRRGGRLSSLLLLRRRRVSRRHWRQRHSPGGGIPWRVWRRRPTGGACFARGGAVGSHPRRSAKSVPTGKGGSYAATHPGAKCVAHTHVALPLRVPITDLCTPLGADQNTKRDTGRKAQQGNIAAAKVRACVPVCLPWPPPVARTHKRRCF